MRQAGRYMPEYRAIREQHSFLELCRNPQLCSEIMCTAVERLGVDAAIVFSDLLPILEPMGMELEFAHGEGPLIHNPVRESADVDRVVELESADALHFVMEAVRQTRADLPAHIPLIGFAGAPFTLASYAIEGGASRDFSAHQDAHVPRSRRVGRADEPAVAGGDRVSQRPNRGRCTGRAAVRQLGRLPGAGRLSRVRAAVRAAGRRAASRRACR